jgi:S1-C subfamily serine protease
MFRTLALLAVVVTASCASALTGIQDTALWLKFERGHCSGTAVGPHLVLSAEHCWGNGNQLVAINGREAHVTKMVKDGRDHVLVRVSVKFDRWARMAPHHPKQGDRVRWIGNPTSLRHQYREGYVTGVDGGQMLLDARLFGGDSGSGVFDDHGHVVGVVSAMRRWQTLQGMSMQLAVAFPVSFSAEQWRSVR